MNLSQKVAWSQTRRGKHMQIKDQNERTQMLAWLLLNVFLPILSLFILFFALPLFLNFFDARDVILMKSGREKSERTNNN